MKRKSFDACLSFVNTGVSGGESGHTSKRTDLRRDRWKDGRRTSLVYKYSCLYR